VQLQDFSQVVRSKNAGPLSQARRPSAAEIAIEKQYRRLKALMRHTAASCFPSMRAGALASPQLRRTRGGWDGGRNLGCRTVALPKTSNRQRATMPTPQGVDATHGGELFPVDESRRTLSRHLAYPLCVSSDFPLEWQRSRHQTFRPVASASAHCARSTVRPVWPVPLLLQPSLSAGSNPFPFCRTDADPHRERTGRRFSLPASGAIRRSHPQGREARRPSGYKHRPSTSW